MLKDSRPCWNIAVLPRGAFYLLIFNLHQGVIKLIKYWFAKVSSLEILSLVQHLHSEFNLYSRKSNTFTKSVKVRSSSTMSAMTGSTVHRIYTGNGTEQCKGLGMMQCPRRVSVAQTTWSDLHRDPARLPCHLYPLTPGALYKRVLLFI